MARAEGNSLGRRTPSSRRRLPRTSRNHDLTANREYTQFETLLDGLLAGVARASAHDIDKEVEHWLSQIVLALDIDRTTLWERTFDDRGFVGILTWHRPGVTANPPTMVSKEISPSITAKILEGRTFVYASVQDIPKEDKPLRAFVEKWGPQAIVALPLQVGSRVIGGLTFGKFRAPREWSPELLRRFRVVAQVFAGALERKRVEAQVGQLQHQVTTAARRSTMGELAAAIAHELNQPLGAIIGNASAARRLISRKKLNAAEVNSTLSDIIEDGKRANEIVHRVRALFRGDDSQKAILEPGPVVMEVVSLLQSEAMIRKISLTTNIESSLPLVLADRIQLQQCIMNLAMNAFEATTASNSENREVILRCESELDSWLSVSVRDSGVGVDPSMRERLFDPFVTTKPNGLGIGLLVTRSIVESHGGRISVSYNPEGGSTFAFTIPSVRTRS